MILNLGAGSSKIEGMVSVDIQEADIQIDLLKYPWIWEDNSIDGIYCSHFFEHVPEWKSFIDECARVLKKGGFLHIKCPHSSNVVGKGCLAHYRTLSVNTLDTYLCNKNEFYSDPPFMTVLERLNWRADFSKHKDIPSWVYWVTRVLNNIINIIININPMITEHILCYWLGGVSEMEWKGIKK